MIKQHILIVEDEEKIAHLISKYLMLEGFSSSHIADGKDVMAHFNATQPALVILDLMLPNVDGLTLCNQIREISDVPIIMLTARVEEIDRLIGFDAGADDYVCKPFKPKELVARVRAILKRVNQGENKNARTITSQNIAIDTQSHKVTVNNHPITLTLNEFNLLKIFIENPYRAFTREELLKRSQGKYVESYERTIDSHIKNLRKKLRAVDPQANHIKAIYGVGYQYDFKE